MDEQVKIKLPDGTSFLTPAENEEECLAAHRRAWAGRGNVYSERVVPAKSNEVVLPVFKVN